MQENSLNIRIKRQNGTKDHICEKSGRKFFEPAGARHCKHVTDRDKTFVKI